MCARARVRVRVRVCACVLCIVDTFCGASCSRMVAMLSAITCVPPGTNWSTCLRRRSSSRARTELILGHKPRKDDSLEPARFYDTLELSPGLLQHVSLALEAHARGARPSRTFE
jgi:hypothetical protein